MTLNGMEELKDRNAYVKATMADGVAVLEGTTTWVSLSSVNNVLI